MHTVNASFGAGLPGVLSFLLPVTPTRCTSAAGEGIRVQGSPAFQCVYLSVGEDLVAIPLDVADVVARAVAEHAASARASTASARAVIAMEPSDEGEGIGHE